MKNQIFINDINNFKKCPEDFKIIFLKTLKSKYIGYDKIFETDYFTKLSENRIIKLLNLIFSYYSSFSFFVSLRFRRGFCITVG